MAEPHRPPRASIVVNNYNYGRFLRQAIDSALGQTYPNVEVIVVDDGSTDDSRAIIASYGDRVVPLLKPNGGQASAFNAGFAASAGEVVIFLDSDDVLRPTAVALVMGEFGRDPGLVKVHWPLRKIDAHGRETGGEMPGKPLPSGDLRAESLRVGPGRIATPPTSGIGWSRAFLKEVMPVPESRYWICADAYLFSLAPLVGGIGRIEEPQGEYRVHGSNHYFGHAFNGRLKRELEYYVKLCEDMADFCRARGHTVDVDAWQGQAWLRRLERMAREVESVVPPEAAIVMVDEEQFAFGGHIGGRTVRPFLERGGQYYGQPADDAAAVAELERMRREGAAFMGFTWPCYWWLEHYTGLAAHLRARYRCVFESDLLRIFDLRPDDRRAEGAHG